MIETVGLISAVTLPLWNIPLIIKIHQRRSSADISMAWALGVWVCLAGMLPAGLASEDVVFKAFAVINVIFFSVVVVQVIRYRR